MRVYWAAILGMSLAMAAGAQVPTGARDITQMPGSPATAPSAPLPAPEANTSIGSTPSEVPSYTPSYAGTYDMGTSPGVSLAPAANIVRVYIDTLSGADTSALSGLLAQALYQSKQVVVTQNQGNASVIVRGEVLRETAATTGMAKPRRGAARSAATATTTSAPASTSDSGLDPSVLPLLGNPGTPVDLSRYRYRLNLELLDPAGDVLWMSGRGEQAQPFAAADTAVRQTVDSMLAAVKAASPAQPASGGPASTVSTTP
jgi:hypothetical protein